MPSPTVFVRESPGPSHSPSLQERGKGEGHSVEEREVTSDKKRFSVGLRGRKEEKEVFHGEGGEEKKGYGKP